MSKGVFPRPRRHHDGAGFLPEEFGLTKRELFAAMAMQGALSRRYVEPWEIVSYAVKCADVLIERLQEPEAIEAERDRYRTALQDVLGMIPPENTKVVEVIATALGVAVP